MDLFLYRKTKEFKDIQRVENAAVKESLKLSVFITSALGPTGLILRPFSLRNTKKNDVYLGKMKTITSTKRRKNSQL